MGKARAKAVERVPMDAGKRRARYLLLLAMAGCAFSQEASAPPTSTPAESQAGTSKPTEKEPASTVAGEAKKESSTPDQLITLRLQWRILRRQSLRVQKPKSKNGTTLPPNRFSESLLKKIRRTMWRGSILDLRKMLWARWMSRSLLTGNRLSQNRMYSSRT